MKNIFLKASLFCLILFTFSCKTDTSYLEPTGAYFLKAKVDGILKEYQIDSATVFAPTGSTQTLSIQVKNGTTKLVINLSNYTGKGEYNLTSLNFATLTDGQNPTNIFQAYEGRIIITDLTEKDKGKTAIGGSFEFKAMDDNGTEKVFEEGSFSLDLKTSSKNPPSNPNPNPNNPNPTDPTDPTDPTNPTNPNPNANMTAKLNGTLLSLDGSGTLMTTPMGNMMTISGDNDDPKILNISIINYNGNGTYALSGTTGNATYQEGYSIDAIFNSTSGSVVITSSSSTNIRGTFSFTATKNGVTKTISEGNFNVSLSTITM
ncbi:hypothetical protein D3C87_270790 [compost metagenome]